MVRPRWKYTLFSLLAVLVSCSRLAWPALDLRLADGSLARAVAVWPAEALSNGQFIEALQLRNAQAQGDLMAWPEAAVFVFRQYRLPEPLPVGGSTTLTAAFPPVDYPLLLVLLDEAGNSLGSCQTPLVAGAGQSYRLDISLADMAPLSSFLLATVAGAEEEPFPVPTLAIGPAGAELRLEADAVAFPAGLRLRQQPGAYTLQVLERLPAYLDGGCLVVEYELPASFVAADAAPQPLVAALQLRTLAGQDLDYQLRLRPGRNRLYLHTAVLGAALSSLTLSGLPPELRLRRVAGSDGQVRETVPANAAASRPTSSAPRPLLVDLGTLYDYPPSAWRHAEYELFAWSLYPAILYFDFADYAIQGRFLSRLAYFVEKKGFQGRLLSNQQLQGRHGYNAHNYNGEGLAAFFNAVDASQFQLNPEEELLRQVAVRAGIISGSSAAWQAGSGGILSISREAPSVTGLRNLLMTHESMHGVFYEEPYHADFARRYWAETMTADQRSFWQLFMDMLSYSTTDEYLMVNELQAYMLQYPQIHNAWYYNTLVRDRLLLAYPEQRPRIEAFYAANPDFFTATARRFNQELFSLTGLIGGDVRCLVPAGRPAD